MTRPRRVVKGQMWAVVRRTHERRGLLRPEPWVRELVAYALAIAQEKTGVRLIAFEAMSNHIHLVVEDTPGRLPDFMNELDEMVAKAANVQWGRRDSLWERSGCKWTALLTPEAVEESVAYAILNCVEAGLVATPQAWGGFVTLPEMLGTTIEVPRPGLRYFSTRSRAPESATLCIAVPSTHAHLDRATWARRIARRVDNEQAAIVRRVGKGKFAGMAKVLATPLDWKPASTEVLSSVTPPAKAGAVPGAAELIRGYRELRRAFLRAYNTAYARLRAAGQAAFPEGTWRWLRECGQRSHEPSEPYFAAA